MANYLANFSRTFFFSAVALSITLFSIAIGKAQEKPELTPRQIAMIEKLQSIVWQTGPTKGEIGTHGKIDVPAGYEFAGAQGAQTLLEAYGNPHDASILGALIPSEKGQGWTLVFKFDDIGYVKDEDKNSLDANAILSTFNSSIPAQNQQRRDIGAEEISKMSWTEPPFYDDDTKNLTWALRLHFPSGDSINYDIRMLGRRGVMEATLLGEPETYREAVPEVKKLLKGFSFHQGNTYADWQPGDQVAQLGLVGLVAGGAAVVAAKTGLFAKLGLILAKGGKAIIIGILVFGAGIWSVVKKLIGGRGTSSNTE